MFHPSRQALTLFATGLGMALLWPSFYTDFWRLSLIGAWSSPAQSQLMTLAAVVAASLIGIIFGRRLSSQLLSHPLALLGLGISTLASNAALVAIRSFPSEPSPLLPVSALLQLHFGVAFVMLFFAWVSLLERLAFSVDPMSLTSAACLGMAIIWVAWTFFPYRDVVAIASLACSALVWFALTRQPLPEFSPLPEEVLGVRSALTWGPPSLAFLIVGILYAIPISLEDGFTTGSNSLVSGRIANVFMLVLAALFIYMLRFSRHAGAHEEGLLFSQGARFIALLFLATCIYLIVPDALTGVGWGGTLNAMWRTLSVALFFCVSILCYTNGLGSVRTFALLFLLSDVVSNLVSYEIMPLIVGTNQKDLDITLMLGASATGGLMLMASFALLLVGFGQKSVCFDVRRHGDAQAVPTNQLPLDQHDPEDTGRSMDPLAREYALTRREQEVISLVCEGLSDAEIAKRLSISASTVGTHLFHAYRKMEVHNRQEAIDLANRSQRASESVAAR